MANILRQVRNEVRAAKREQAREQRLEEEYLKLQEENLRIYAEEYERERGEKNLPPARKLDYPCSHCAVACGNYDLTTMHVLFAKENDHEWRAVCPSCFHVKLIYDNKSHAHYM